MNSNIQDIQFIVPIEKISEAFLQMVKPYIVKEVVDVKLDNEYLTRKEVARLLNISLPTLNKYTKRKLLKAYKIGARVLYKKYEVDVAPIRVNYGREQYD